MEFVTWNYLLIFFNSVMECHLQANSISKGEMSKIVSNAKLHVFSGVITHLRFFLAASKTMWLLCLGSLTRPRKLGGQEALPSLATTLFFSAAKKKRWWVMTPLKTNSYLLHPEFWGFRSQSAPHPAHTARKSSNIINFWSKAVVYILVQFVIYIFIELVKFSCRCRKDAYFSRCSHAGSQREGRVFQLIALNWVG